MSSGVFEYSLEEKATLLDQFADVMELMRERQRPAQKISRAFQSLIADDDIIVQPKVTVVSGEKVYHITGDFNSAAEAIEAGDYPVKWGYADGKASAIPMVILPGDVRARIVVPGRVVYNRELPKLLPNMLDPFNALRFGAKFQSEQLERPLAAVWRDAAGEFWYIYLHRYGDERLVDVSEHNPDDHWRGHVGFLVRE